jgi:hypothetical protein
MSSTRVKLLAIASVLVIALAQPTAAVAYNCHPSRGDNTNESGAGRFRSGIGLATYVRAVRAIVDVDEFPYAEAGGSSATYIDIHNALTGTTYYARMGWVVPSTDLMYYFTEYNGGGSWNYLFSTAYAPVTAFKIVWNNAPGSGLHQFTLWAGANYTVMTLFGDPVLNWSPTDGQIGTRTKSDESQFPGRVLNKMEMTTTQAHVDGSWVAFGSAALGAFSTATWANFLAVAGDPTWFRSYDGDC